MQVYVCLTREPCFGEYTFLFVVLCFLNVFMKFLTILHSFLEVAFEGMLFFILFVVVDLLMIC